MTPGDMTPVVLAGPTGVGKSALALAVAELRPVGIVSLDARQIYRGMELGSDAPSAVALERVPHRGVGERELDQPWSAGQAAVDARRWAAEFQAEGRLPIVLGGSGLYLQALLVGLDRGPTDPEIRRSLESRLKAEGLASLVDELSGVPGGDRVDSSNPRRVLRALEFTRLGGDLRPQFNDRRASFGARRVCVDRSSERLRSRIRERAQAMFEGGLVEETRRLEARWGDEVLSRLPTLGHDQVRAYLRGEETLDATLEKVVVATWRYAKRQRTWFRKYGGFEFLDLDEVSVERVVRHIAFSP